MKQFFKQSFFFMLFISKLFTTDYPEFLYPVGSIQFEETHKVCVLYQKGTYLELLLWDPVTKKAMKGLSHYTPAGLVILPSQTAFSFIDHQRIRIKTVTKKSPKALDLYPLYDLSLLHWIDDKNCYCSARERIHYNLFHITSEGDFYRLTRSRSCDYTYPQKIDNSFFYIKKDQAGTHTIEKTVYPINKIQECESCLANLHITESSLETLALVAHQEGASSKACLPEGMAEVLFTCTENNKTLTFLTMKNAQEGFFLKHLDYPFIERFEKIMTFECWYFYLENGVWKTKSLFTFTIPLHFLYGAKRLYESGLRLFPVYSEKDVYYASANEQGSLDVYRYNMSDTSIACVTQSAQEHYFFPPCLCEGVAYYGGMLMYEEHSDQEGLLSMTLNENGEQIITFPFIKK